MNKEEEKIKKLESYIKELETNLSIERGFSKSLGQDLIETRNHILEVRRSVKVRETVEIILSSEMFFSYKKTDREEKFLKHAIIDCFHKLLSHVESHSYLEELRKQITL